MANRRRIPSVQARDTAVAGQSRWMRPVALAGVTVLLLGFLAAFNPGNVRARFWITSSTPQIRSLAVLPLKNLSGDPSQEYFADGMTDELITYLSQISGLRVISYTSTYRYKLTKKTVPEIARELGVDGVVEGSVQRAGERVRVNAQLIYAPQDTHVWARSFDGNFQDALTVQSSLAGRHRRAGQNQANPRPESTATNPSSRESQGSRSISSRGLSPRESWPSFEGG